MNLLPLIGDAAIIRGASYTFGIIPKEIVPPSTDATFVWPLTDCTANATIYRDESCQVVLAVCSVEMPTTEGDPILFSLSPAETTSLPHTPRGISYHIKALLTRADGTVEPRGVGPVEVRA